jgi:ribonuclease VapC
LVLEARSAQITIEPVTEAQARIARQAYGDFGKMSGHPAKLNFGDCFSYALAKTKREPLSK